MGTYTDSARQAADKSTADSFEARLNSAMEKKDDKELRNVCQQFEGIMLGMLYRQMKVTVQKSDFMKDDSSTELFQSMLDDELVEEASKNSKLGIADVLYKQLSKQMGIKPKTTVSDSGTGSAAASDAVNGGTGEKATE